MVKKSILKAAALLLAVLMTALSVAACGGAGSAAKDGTQIAEGVEANKAPDATQPVNIKIFGYFTTQFPLDNNPVKDAIEKATHTKLEFEMPPINNYKERLQIMLASADYPEVVMFESHTDKLFIDAVNNGIVLPITKYVKESPELWKKTRDVSWDAMMVNNEIVGIPQTTVMRADGYWARKDWLDNVGLTIPKDGYITLDEFTEILKRFTKNDPDKNGKNDTFGFIPSTNNGSLNPVSSWNFGILGWQESTGKYPYMDLQYSREHDNYKKALEYTSMLWKQGFLDPNWPQNRAEMFKQRFNQGIGGVTNGFAGQYPDHITALRKNFPNAELTYITGIKDKDGKAKGVAFGNGYWFFSSLTTKAKGKEQAIIKMFNYRLSDQGWDLVKYGAEGLHYNVQNGKKVFTPQYADYYKWRGSFKLVMPYDDADYFISADLPDDTKEKLNGWLKMCVDNLVVSKDRGFRPAAADKPEFIDYIKVMDETRSKIIVGEVPVSKWDDALAGWYKAGGEEYVQQMNEYIKKMEKK